MSRNIDKVKIGKIIIKSPSQLTPRIKCLNPRRKNRMIKMLFRIELANSQRKRHVYNK